MLSGAKIPSSSICIYDLLHVLYLNAHLWDVLQVKLKRSNKMVEASYNGVETLSWTIEQNQLFLIWPVPKL